MKSSTNQISNSSSIHENQSDVRIPDEELEPSVYLARNGIRVVLAYENDNPKAIKAFEGNQAVEMEFKTYGRTDTFLMKFSNGVCYADVLQMDQLKCEFKPDISKWRPGFRFWYEIIWIDSATNKILKQNSGYLSAKSTESLYDLLATRETLMDVIFNTPFIA